MEKRVLYYIKESSAFKLETKFDYNKFSFICAGPLGQFISGSGYTNNFLVLANNKIVFLDKKSIKSFLVNLRNTLNGVSYGFFTLLRLKGVGFRSWVDVSQRKLVLIVGFSHYILYSIPNDVLIKSKKSKILIFGIDKQRVTQVASEIQSLRKPDVYKGKGIQYMEKVLLLKVGKQR